MPPCHCSCLLLCCVPVVIRGRGAVLEPAADGLLYDMELLQVAFPLARARARGGDERHTVKSEVPSLPGARPSGGRLKAEPTRNQWPEEMYRHPLDTATARDGRRKRSARSSGLIGAAPTRLEAGPNAGPWRSLLATPTRIRALRHRSGLTDPRDPVAPPHGRRPAAMLLAKYGDARSS